jgi:hypothetical protein
MTQSTQLQPPTARAIKELRHRAQRNDRHLSLSCRITVVEQLELHGLVVEHGRPGDDTDCGCGWYVLTRAGLDRAAMEDGQR